MPVPDQPPPRENLLLNLACNLALPALVLSRLSKPEYLGPVWGLVMALVFPLGYGIWDFWQRRQTNFISVIGFTSVLLTGGLGLMKADGIWFAVKEAAVPAIIGGAMLASMRSRRPLLHQILLNEQMIDLPRVQEALVERGNEPAFHRLVAHATYLIVGSFILSAVLNFILARYLLRSPTGSVEFNAELARMTLLSWPVIVIPSLAVMMFALWRLINGLLGLTELTFEQIIRSEPAKK